MINVRNVCICQIKRHLQYFQNSRKQEYYSEISFCFVRQDCVVFGVIDFHLNTIRCSYAVNNYCFGLFWILAILQCN